MVWPEEAGSGEEPHNIEKEASDRRRAGLSPGRNGGCCCRGCAPGYLEAKEADRQSRPDRPRKEHRSGFLAYERMLVSHPELAGNVEFWAFLQPSRLDVADYREYMQRIQSTAGRINAELKQPGWQPIRLEFREDLKRAVAAYKSFDVLLVNPIYDGMNLVAKEGMFLNTVDGVLVLSENAGAHEQLGAHALSVNPFDVDATANALYRGLSMPIEERRARGEEIRRQVRSNDIFQWLRSQLDDIREYAPSRLRHQRPPR